MPVLHKAMGPERFSFLRAFATLRLTRLLANDIAGAAEGLEFVPPLKPLLPGQWLQSALIVKVKPRADLDG